MLSSATPFHSKTSATAATQATATHSDLVAALVGALCFAWMNRANAHRMREGVVDSVWAGPPRRRAGGQAQRTVKSSLAAADLVICQTGCISHNAYWRVKDFCKRTDKQCVLVETPSTSSRLRSVQQIAKRDHT